MSSRNFLIQILPVVFLALLSAACSGRTATPDSGPTGPTSIPTMLVLPGEATAVPTPTLTPVPLALQVNGETVSLAEFEAELRQLQEAHAALGTEATAEEQSQKVIDSLVETLLLAQGAAESGFTLTEAELQAEIDRLASLERGGTALADWQALRGYDERTFRAALRRSMAAAWQRDHLAAAVPEFAEQVRARQILALDEAVANRALEQVRVPGVNFATYAFRYDPLTGGDLGWFPRGYLTQPEVEEAAFTLQPGEISEVVPSQIGYHVLQVIAREPQKQLSPDARRMLQRQAIQEWLIQRRAQSQVEILIP
jgi:peptidyl-prolyl cis-trans isomerase C